MGARLGGPYIMHNVRFQLEIAEFSWDQTILGHFFVLAPGVKLRWNEAANPKTSFDTCAQVLQRGPLHARQPAVSVCGSIRG